MSSEFESEILSSLREDLDIYNDMIREVATGLLKDEISKYPIFIAHKEELTLGRMVIDHVALATEWSISASHLEEFVNKGVIAKNNIEAFKKIYKDPLEQICIFMVHEGEANFIFNPYR